MGNTVVTIDIPDGYSTIRQEFEVAVSRILPVLCFERHDVDAFLETVQLGEIANKIHTVQCADGHSGFVGERRRHEVTFVIPGTWAQRYEIVEQSITQLQEQPECGWIHIRINEGVPSHNAYFAGLLPGLGFEMLARLEMVLDPPALDQLPVVSLPEGFAQVVITHERSADAARVLHEAYLPQHADWSPEKQEQEFRSWLGFVDAETEEALALHWIAVETGDQLAGVCLGRGPYEDAMAISELGVLPSHRRRGLGRFLLVRCMQRLREHYVEPARFRLSPHRTNGPAISLYRSLGFKVDEVYTRADWRQQG